jgi:hypothetical protein
MSLHNGMIGECNVKVSSALPPLGPMYGAAGVPPTASVTASTAPITPRWQPGSSPMLHGSRKRTTGPQPSQPEDSHSGPYCPGHHSLTAATISSGASSWM